MTSATAAHFLDELRWRGMLHQSTSGEELARHLQRPGRVAYAGFDPTSDSITIGNFIPVKLLMHWQQAGHKPIVLMGGGTGLIGDPSGRDDERSLMTREQVKAHVDSQRRIMERFLDFDPRNPNAAVILDNADWLTELGYIQVLRDVGKHFSVNEMIQRDSVKKRLQEREHGISYTEFSYILLQSYDFLHLRRTRNCTVQLGGADQYGNIVGGIDLIRREYVGRPAEEGQAFGITAPLVARSDGKKMSKSSGQAVWMSADTRSATSPYAFYQYWINLPDSDVVQWLKWYTMLNADEVDDLARQHEAAPQQRAAHRALARRMTSMTHGEAELKRVEQASEALFSGNVREIPADMLPSIAGELPHLARPRGEVLGAPFADVLTGTEIAKSRREMKDFLSQNAVTAGGVPVTDIAAVVEERHLIGGRWLLVRRGKKTWLAIELR